MAAHKITKIQDFKGLISAPFTPFDAAGELNLDVIPEYVDYLTAQGVKAVFVNGTTGEGLSLTVDERKELAECWVDNAKHKLDLIIIQVGANSIKDVKELAAHAEMIGASGIASLPPLFYKPPTLDHLVAYFKEIADAASNSPLMLYHIPSYSGVEISVADFLPKARALIPTFCGAKFTSTDVRDLLKCHRLPGPAFKLLSGFDEVLLPCMACGVTAAVGVTYNFMGQLSNKMINSFELNDRKKAESYQEIWSDFFKRLCDSWYKMKSVSEATEVIAKHGHQPISAFKAAMNIVSKIDFGSPRLPLVPLDSTQKDALAEDLKRLGMV